MRLDARFLAPPFGAGRLGVFARLVFAVPFADLLFDFFGDQVDRGIKIAFEIFRKEVRSRERQANRAAKLAFGGLGMIMLERDPGEAAQSISEDTTQSHDPQRARNHRRG